MMMRGSIRQDIETPKASQFFLLPFLSIFVFLLFLVLPLLRKVQHQRVRECGNVAPPSDVDVNQHPKSAIAPTLTAAKTPFFPPLVPNTTTRNKNQNNNNDAMTRDCEVRQ
ncbi:unnamed protein product, partial [Notodromas monacha]